MKIMLISALGAIILFFSTVLIAQSTSSTKVVGYILQYNVNTRAWLLPVSKPKHLSVYVNGLRYVQNRDYKIDGTYIRNLTTNMAEDSLVLIDYE